MEEKNVTYNVYGGQLSLSSDNATSYATQNNGVSGNELDKIIQDIVQNLSELEKEDAENIKDIAEMAKEELEKPEPKVSRLRNCVTLIAPMFTVANGIPSLVNNLQRLVDYITPYIG